MKASDLIHGGKYNWKGQPEHLVYMGMCEPRNGRWHQFAKVESPSVVWCEVLSADLEHFEETTAAPDVANAQDSYLAKRTAEYQIMGYSERESKEAAMSDWYTYEAHSATHPASSTAAKGDQKP